MKINDLLFATDEFRRAPLGTVAVDDTVAEFPCAPMIRVPGGWLWFECFTGEPVLEPPEEFDGHTHRIVHLPPEPCCMACGGDDDDRPTGREAQPFSAHSRPPANVAAAANA